MIALYFFWSLFFIRSELVQVNPSWSDLDWWSKFIRSDLCTCLCTKALFFNVSCVFKVKCGYTVMCKYKKECLIKIIYWKVHFVTFKSCHLVTEKHFPIYDLAWNQQYFYSCLYALKPFPNMCTLIFMFNFFVLKDGIWGPSEWVQKLIRGCEFLASDNNLLL